MDPEPHWLRLEGARRHAACVVAARAGDRRALDALVADLTPVVWHVARGHGLDRATAEDVVQTVWLAVTRHLDGLADPRALVEWLVVTTRREARRTWSPARREAEVGDGSAELVGEHGLPDDAVLLDDRDRRLWRAFGRLSQRCQELLRLTALSGRAEYRAVAGVRGTGGSFQAVAGERGSAGRSRAVAEAGGSDPFQAVAGERGSSGPFQAVAEVRGSGSFRAVAEAGGSGGPFQAVAGERGGGPSVHRCQDVLRAHLDAETGWPGLPSPARPQHPPRDPRVRLRSVGPVLAGAPAEVEFGYTVVRDALTTSGHDAPPPPEVVRVLLHADGATVEPLTRVFELPIDFDARAVRFRVVPGERGTLELVFRVYLGDGRLLQEVRADLPVGEG